MKILFICTANLCRSVAAEKLLRHYGGAAFETRSRGTAAGPYGGMPGLVRDFLARAGVTQLAHKPALAGEADVDWAEVILVMENHHYEALSDRFPQSMRKMHLFLDYCNGITGAELEDPAGRSREVFDKVLTEIDKGIKKIIEDSEVHR